MIKACFFLSFVCCSKFCCHSDYKTEAINELKQAFHTEWLKIKFIDRSPEKHLRSGSMAEINAKTPPTDHAFERFRHRHFLLQYELAIDRHADLNALQYGSAIVVVVDNFN
jgi:hypothetical protein